MTLYIKCQVFRYTENTEKSWELSTEREKTESCGKHCFLFFWFFLQLKTKNIKTYFQVKLITKNVLTITCKISLKI